jgi:hypothetical protein
MAVTVKKIDTDLPKLVVFEKIKMYDFFIAYDTKGEEMLYQKVDFNKAVDLRDGSFTYFTTGDTFYLADVFIQYHPQS